MIFQLTWHEVLKGEKTQTRRLVGPHDYAVVGEADRQTITGVINIKKGPSYKWRVGRVIAVQPGRGQKAIARIRITAIRRERLQDITREDAVKEGFGYARTMAREDKDGASRLHFVAAWNRLHTKPGTRWENNPSVWVLEFEKVEP